MADELQIYVEADLHPDCMFKGTDLRSAASKSPLTYLADLYAAPSSLIGSRQIADLKSTTSTRSGTHE